MLSGSLKIGLRLSRVFLQHNDLFYFLRFGFRRLFRHGRNRVGGLRGGGGVAHIGFVTRLHAFDVVTVADDDQRAHHYQ